MLSRLHRLATHSHPPSRSSNGADLLSWRARLAWTLGNLLMLSGLYLLLYVGGLHAQIAYNRFAARGDSDVPPPAVAMPIAQPQPATPALPDIFTVPVLRRHPTETEHNATKPAATPRGSTISRIVIPAIGVDSKVVEVGWQVQQQEDGSEVAVWQVAEYAVGHHRQSANPGEVSNIVLAGHVGGYGKVFRDLIALEPGADVTLYSDNQQYRYRVRTMLLVDEGNATPEQRAANAQYIAPTDEEVVTLVTCWPDSGPDAFNQRVIVQAVPYRTTRTEDAHQHHPRWTIR